MAVYAIGDLQGCYDPFRRLLDTIGFDPAEDTLWLTGDLVNRGPKSLKTVRFVRSLGDAAVTVLGNHDLHFLALSQGVIRDGKRFETLAKLLRAPEVDELVDWMRHRPLAVYSESMDTLLVHAGVYPNWTLKKALARAEEVEVQLRGDNFATLLGEMYGNSPALWSGKLKGYKRLRFIINCFTRMRMVTPDLRLNLRFTGSPWRSRGTSMPWFEHPAWAWQGTRIVFGHWSALGLVVLPDYVSLDTGCVWGRQLTAARLDGESPEVWQVEGEQGIGS